MTQSEIIKGRLKVSRWWLDSVLPRLTPEMLEWAPEKSMRTVSGQLIEIIAVEAQFGSVVTTGKELSEDEISTIVGDASSLDGLKKVLVELRGQTLAKLERLTEAELAEDVTLPQWYGAYWPKPGPLGEHFRNIAEHEYYHTGQLISYLWSRGDNPYEW